MDANGHLEFLLEGHGAGAFWIDWSPDATRLLTGSADGTAKVWEISGQGAAEVHMLPARAGAITGVAFSPDGNRVMTRSETRVLDLWDVGPTGDAEVANIADAAELVSFLSDGRHVTTGGPDGSLGILDIETGEHVHRPTEWFELPPGPFSGYKFSFDFSPDGRSVATYSYTPVGWSTLRDVETGAELFAGGGPLVFDWSPDSRFAAMYVQGSGIEIVDGASGRQIGLFEEAGFWIQEGLRFGPNDLVAAPFWDEDRGDHVKIWDWRRDEVVGELPVPYDAEVMQFDADGSRIAIGRANTEIWDVQTERLLVTFPSSQIAASDLAFSPDGSRLAEGDPDGTVRVFDSTSGEEVLVLLGHDSVDQVAFSPDGSMLATAGDGIVRIWALDIDDLLEIARQSVTRSLTDEECRRYLHVESC